MCASGLCLGRLKPKQYPTALQSGLDADAEESKSKFGVFFKGDVMGSLEALTDYADALPATSLGARGVHVLVLRTAIGDVSEADVDFAAERVRACVWAGVRAGLARASMEARAS